MKWRRYWQRPDWMKKRCGEAVVQPEWDKAAIGADDKQSSLLQRRIVHLAVQCLICPSHSTPLS
jgi:hypothetical protein